MSVSNVSRNNFVPVEELRAECSVKIKDSDQHIARICGHFFMTCAAISGIAFAASGAPAALASFVVCLLCATACYFPNEIFVYRGPHFWPRQHYVPVPLPQPGPRIVPVVGGGPAVVVDARPRHQPGGSHFVPPRPVVVPVVSAPPPLVVPVAVAPPRPLFVQPAPAVVIDNRPRHQPGGNHAPPARPVVVDLNAHHKVGGNHVPGGPRHLPGGNRRR